MRSPTTTAVTVVSANSSPCVAERPGASDQRAEAITNTWSVTSSTVVGRDSLGARRAKAAMTTRYRTTNAAFTSASSMYWPAGRG